MVDPSFELKQSFWVNNPYIDIHTHHCLNSQDVISVQNLFLQDMDFNSELNLPFTAAIHPWHAHRYAPEQIAAMLKNLEKYKNLIAIGETGLDKGCKVDYHLQKTIFELQLRFAEDHQKPVIIHAVKSWNDLIGSLKHSRIPWVLHGYSAGIELTKQLINLGCYFSLGKSVLRPSPHFVEAIRIIPMQSLFFETDESAVKIEEIYLEASRLLDIPLPNLKKQINFNYHAIFCKQTV